MPPFQSDTTRGPSAGSDSRNSSSRLAAFLVLLLLPVSTGGIRNSADVPPGDDCCGGRGDSPVANSIAQRKTTPVSRPAPSGKINRTVPEVAPPGAALEFSKDPTVAEFFRSRLFEEPLVPVGGTPVDAENAALAAALRGYAARTAPDDFSSLDDFLARHPTSPWRAALLTNLGLEAYRTGRYSRTIETWAEAWRLSKDATGAEGKGIADRAAGELAGMYARLGRMEDLEPLLNSVKDRVFVGPATEKISGALAGLANMKERPEIAFKCGPLALHRIKLSLDPKNGGDATIIKAASTQKGFSLTQVAELSRKIDLNYQMAFREKGAPILVPSVVHWKVGHYAAIIREEGGRFLIQDPTFQNDVWATRAALETESSGYFLVGPDKLPAGWRTVDPGEGGKIWGKGNVCCKDPNPTGCKDPKKGGQCGGTPCKGMAVADVHLMLVSLNITDEPVGYSPPVGEKISFQVTYNQREANQPSGFSYTNFGPKWTFEWLSYITDNPFSTAADVKYYMRGGGTRVFTGFNSATQTFAYQQYDQDRLVRTSPSTYERTSLDGSKKIFGLSDGSSGTARRIFLTQVVDPFGNAVSLTYDTNFRIVAITDAIGQVSTITYAHPIDIYRVTKITDPFGRFATFDYDLSGRLIQIADVIGIVSQLGYETTSDFINSMSTPYGTTTFIKAESGTTASLDTIYPNGQRDRVEFNQATTLGIPQSVPANQLPAGMLTHNDYMSYRNTFYWDPKAYATAYPDYTKARVYHWLHTADSASAAGILESVKEPLEGRVWYDYTGQSDPIFVGTSNKPAHVGRVLDDGTTQLSTYEYNNFGQVTKAVDPVGRTMSYIYDATGMDLLEVRQTRGGQNELLYKATYNAQHQPLTETDAAGQTTTYTYNARGQKLTEKNPKNEVTTYSYDNSGYRISMDGPLAGPADLRTTTYDVVGRVRTMTDESGYTQTVDYDALDRPTKITLPDGSFQQYTYTNLDVTQIQDRAGRITSLQYNSLRQLTKRTDPLNRTTTFEWCRCGDMERLTDAMGRTTTWQKDVQGRTVSKVYADGSQILFQYENNTSRLRQRTDEKSQTTRYTYNRDNTVSGFSYGNVTVATPPVSFSYDPNYERVTAMTDGTGVTRYTYHPVGSTPAVGAFNLASIDGPLPNDTIQYTYDELGRTASMAINGVSDSYTYDPAGRLTIQTNALGTFNYSYDGGSSRETLQTYPNGQTRERAYGTNAQDQLLQRITHKKGATQLSEFLYTRDIARDGRITTWSQQAATQTPSVYTFGYDSADQVTSAAATNASPNSFGYSYDPAGNRLTETIGGTPTSLSYNSLNEVTSSNAAPGASSTNEWDGEQRLTAVSSGNERTEFNYDGLGRRVGIRKLVNGAEVSNRKFVWREDEIGEERDAGGAVVKRFFSEGMKIETGPAAGVYFYTRDQLQSVREMTDNTGVVRARYFYDPFGRALKVTGDLDSDFQYAGMFWSPEANINLTYYRAYDPTLGRWLSRDPLDNAENTEGSNLYAYVHNDPVNRTDPFGLHECEKPNKCWTEFQAKWQAIENLQKCRLVAEKLGLHEKGTHNYTSNFCRANLDETDAKFRAYDTCMDKPCPKPPPPPMPRPPKPKNPPKKPKPTKPFDPKSCPKLL